MYNTSDLTHKEAARLRPADCEEAREGEWSQEWCDRRNKEKIPAKAAYVHW